MTRFVPSARGPRRALLAMAALIAALLLAGCSALSGSSAPTQPAAPAAAGGGGLEKSSINVGVLPIVDVAAVQRAQAAGYFAAEGLTVNLVTIQGGAVAIPQLVSGDLDLSWSSWPSVILAQANGVSRFTVLPEGYNTAPGSFQIVVPAGSPITKPSDLAGKKIATNTFKSITEFMGRSAMQTAGVDPNSVQFVELAFPDMIPALQNKQIDAAILLEPFITVAGGQQAVKVLDVITGPNQDLSIAGVTSTAKWAQENPKTLAAFEKALGKAQAEMTDRKVVEQILPTYTTIKPDTTGKLTLGTWPTTLDASRLQRVADLMLQYGGLPARFDVTPLLKPAG